MQDEIDEAAASREQGILKHFEQAQQRQKEDRRLRQQGVAQKLRGWHRDLGCLAIGLTFVYALSGLALNHTADINTSQRQAERTWNFVADKPGATPFELAHSLQLAGDILETPLSVYPVNPRELELIGELEVAWPDGRTMIYTPATGQVLERWVEPIPVIGAMNWLHRARGKAGWIFVADTYAVVLLFLAVSGTFLLPRGRRGLKGRAGLLILVGIAIPVVYLALS